MPGYPFKYLIRLGILFLSVVGTGLLHAQAISANSIYVNQEVGVRARFSGDWNVITSREQAPDILKPNFPADKGPNDSPLFIGMHTNGELFMRLLTETYFDDLKSYARVLSQAVNSQGLEVSSMKLSSDNATLEMEYVHPQLGLRFRERAALLPDSQVIRMALWTTQLNWDSFTPDIEQAFADVELHDVINGSSGWQHSWAESIGGQVADLDGIPLVAEDQNGSGPLACADPSSSMLWKVEGGDLSSRSTEVYLFGSIHVGKADFYPLPDIIESTFRHSDHLVFEVDPESVADPSVIMDMQARGMLPRGQTLADVVSPEVIADFRRVMGNMGLPVESFMGMQPWFLTLMLSGLQMNALGYQPQYGLESYFMTQKSPGTDILELESIQQQIGFLEALNAETYLAYTIKGFEEGSDEINSLINAWQCADKGPLTRMLFADFEDETLNDREKADMEALMDELYTRRNVGMADRIQDITSDSPGSYFIVVGSAHLLGEDSVVALLRERGYQVTPVILDH